jgi:hypothetical protein
MFEPILDLQSGEVVGTKIVHVNHVDLAGYIPAWVINNFGIKTLVETIETMVELAKAS